jgi:hypothetical protein
VARVRYEPVEYATVATAIEPTGMIARGGFVPDPSDGVPALADGREVRTVVVVGNVGGAIWPIFRAGARSVPDPLDEWTRRVLGPIAATFGAGFVHPSDEPFIPMQRWAQRAEDVFESPIGLLIHPDHGLWHAYRGALLFPGRVDGLPPVGRRRSPCATCVAQPCRTACPVDAFATEGTRLVGYDHERCRRHVRSGREPRCLTAGCAARRACPVNAAGHYDVDQMTFHMRAFTGVRHEKSDSS